MRSILPPSRARGTAILASLALAAGLAAASSQPAAADPTTPTARTAPTAHLDRAVQVASETVRRGKPDRTITFYRGRAGEAFVTATVSARGVSWGDKGNTSAVVSAYVDGHYATDIVITSAQGIRRQFALGHLAKGRHTLRLHYATTRSPSDAGVARLQQISFWTVRPSSPAYVAAEYAPILYGRNVKSRGGKFQNNRTDTPLVAWHQVLPAGKPGHSILEYSVVWSNEDGGTPTNWLMAQWGRTTDIEWIYRVEVNAKGKRVPGSGEFQSPSHVTDVFHGRYDGTHPILQTCTDNNNVCDARLLKKQKPRQQPDPMRFFLSTRETLAAGQPREHLMDANPWTYQVMAQEMHREGKVESPADPSTPAMSDQRNYLYLSLTRSTDPASSAGVDGLAVDVTLHDDPTVYSSDHETFTGQPGVAQSVNRDGPSATTVELPAGTTWQDIATISVRRTPFIGTDDGSPITVTSVGRAFLLGRDYLPQPSQWDWTGSEVLTTAEPTEQLYPSTTG